MFSETGSFYYSKEGDLTKSVQSQHYPHGNNQSQMEQSNEKGEVEKGEGENLIDKEQKKQLLGFQSSREDRIDDRFFWNKYMLQEIIDLYEVKHTVCKLKSQYYYVKLFIKTSWYYYVKLFIKKTIVQALKYQYPGSNSL